MPPALAWLREHRRLAAELVAVLIALAAGWALHRPAPRVEVRETVKWKERVVDHVVTKTVTVAAKQEDRQRIVHRTTTTKPDGTRVETEDITTARQVDLRVGQAGEVDLRHLADTTAARETSVVQTPAPAPSWRVSGLVGLQLSGTPVYGGQVSRRILGPVWAGAWGLSSGVGGVSLGVEW